MISRSTNVRAALRSRQRGFLLNPARFAAGGGGDPDFANVSLLCHFDGANGSTTFTDSSSNGFTLSRRAGVEEISTAESKFGGASVLIPSNTSGKASLRLNTSSAFDFGTGNFTVEFWFRYSTTPQPYARIFQTRDGDVNAGISIVVNDNNVFPQRLQLYLSSNGSSFDIFASASLGDLPVGTWQHHALVRNGTTFNYYVEGTSVAVFSSSSAIYYNAADQIIIGGNSITTDRSVGGYIDELRVTKGVARYTSAFTPPTAAFPNS